MPQPSDAYRLPPELLVMIFSYISYWELVAASQVCAYWRLVSHQQTSLWSCIIWPTPGWIDRISRVHEFVEMFSCMLARAGRAPIRLNVTLGHFLPHLDDPIVRDIGRHLSQIRHLELRFQEFCLEDSPSGQRLLGYLCQPAPLLETLTFRYVHFPRMPSTELCVPCPIPDSLFSGSAPRLRRFTILGRMQIGEKPRYLHAARRVVLNKAGLTMTELQALDEFCPRLQSLSVTVFENTRSPRPLRFNELRELFLDLPNSRLLPFLPHSRIPRLTIRHPCRDVESIISARANDYTTLIVGPSLSFPFLLFSTDSSHIRLISPLGLVAFHSVRPPVPLFPPKTLDHLQRLFIEEEYLSAFASFDPLPHLALLGVRLRPRYEPSDTLPDIIMSSDGPTLSCPNLRALVISARMSPLYRIRRVLNLEALDAFIGRLIGSRVEKVEKVVVHNAILTESSWPVRFVETVRLEDNELRWPPK